MPETMNIGLMFEIHECPVCGIPYAASEKFFNRTRELGRDFYCPRGHVLTFGPSDAAKLRKQLVQQEHRANSLQRDLQLEEQAHRTTEHQRAAMKGQVTKIKTRAANGVCPCCNRYFANLHQHMAKQHPNWSPDSEGS